MINKIKGLIPGNTYRIYIDMISFHECFEFLMNNKKQVILKGEYIEFPLSKKILKGIINFGDCLYITKVNFENPDSNISDVIYKGNQYMGIKGLGMKVKKKNEKLMEEAKKKVEEFYNSMNREEFKSHLEKAGFEVFDGDGKIFNAEGKDITKEII